MQLDGKQLHLEPGQTVIPHGPDRELTVAEVLARRKSAGAATAHSGEYARKSHSELPGSVFLHSGAPGQRLGTYLANCVY